MMTRWKDYEDLTRERRAPPTVNYHAPAEPTLFEQLYEWIARHWLLYLLIVSAAIAGGCLLLDAIRRPQ
jgi:hypothetical protein